jgi:hypothetical protein
MKELINKFKYYLTSRRGQNFLWLLFNCLYFLGVAYYVALSSFGWAIFYLVTCVCFNISAYQLRKFNDSEHRSLYFVVRKNGELEPISTVDVTVPLR